MIFVFYILAAGLVYLSYRSFRGGMDYLSYFKSELQKPASAFAPFATVVAPCKGLDEGLHENLSALLAQDYAAYEVIFVVDDERDAAVEVILEMINRRDAETQRSAVETFKKVAPERRNQNDEPPEISSSASPRLGGENSSFTKLIVAPKATDSSQKVTNLREAVLHVSPRSEIFVFVDSDARPSRNWLRHLVAPLADENIGAATGYRWFIARNLTFASELRSVWNASIASSLGPNMKSNFCWGGSTAIRREVFERLDIRERWRTVVSDDFTITRVLKDAAMPIYFVPQALVPSIQNCTLRELFEFTTRQIKITRVYAPHLLKLALLGSALFNVVVVWAFVIAISSGPYDPAFAAAIFTLAAVSIFSVAKAALRMKAVSMVLRHDRDSLGKQRLSQLTLWSIAPALFFYNSIAALVSREITWRGITYKLESERITKVIRKP